MNPTYFAFCHNGKVWRVSSEGRIAGTLRLPGLADCEADIGRTNHIAHCATGRCDALVNFTWGYLGGEQIWFEGSLAAWGKRKLPMGVARIADQHDPLLPGALAAMYALSEGEVAHALDNLDTSYRDEAVVRIAGSGRCLHSPAFPEPASYVRVVVDGYELAYWDCAEWMDEPGVGVMGAILGAAQDGANLSAACRRPCNLDATNHHGQDEVPADEVGVLVTLSGVPIKGTLESVKGYCDIQKPRRLENGKLAFEFVGGTTYWYDSQETVTSPGGETIFVSEDGTEFPESQVKLVRIPA